MKKIRILLLSVLAGCGGGNEPDAGSQPAPNRSIGGMVTGLSGTVVLLNNGTTELVVSANGAFVFPATVPYGSSYSVTVKTPPEGQDCNVTGGTGQATANISGILVTCRWQVAAALPLLKITTQNAAPITSTDVYVNGTFELLEVTGASAASGALEIRGRGNSTWNYPKKPYRLKLGTSTPILGMPASRHWVLLANYLDKTLIRNELAFEFSRRTGLAWTPRSQEVVVQLNDEYLGIYQLTEHVRISTDRVDIPELKRTDTDPVAITGGYLMEVDYRQGETYCRRTNRGVVLCFGNPETLLEVDWAPHKAYIDGYIDTLEAALYGPQFADPVAGYAAYIDVDSAVNFYLVHELFKNVDSNFFSSVFLHKPRGGKIVFGPVWDFDLAAGNAQWARYGFFDGADPTGWHTRKQDTRVSDPPTNWYARLFQDPAFEQRVRTRWAQLQADGTLTGLLSHADRRAAWLSQVQLQNFQRWPILDTTLQPDLSPVRGPYESHVQAMRSWLQQRITWMSGQLR